MASPARAVAALRLLAPAALFAATIVFGSAATGVNASQASAEPIAEGDIKAECAQASGTYSASHPKGHTQSSCTMSDGSYDLYFDGEWLGTYDQGGEVIDSPAQAPANPKPPPGLPDVPIQQVPGLEVG
jgi:hypothetical protein